MSNIACEVALWYNKPINIVAPAVLQTPKGWISLYERNTMTTLPLPAQDGNPPQKRCIACGNIFPATTEFFYQNKRAKDGLSGQCRECTKQYAAARYHIPEVRTRVLEYSRLPEVQARHRERSRKRSQRPEHKVWKREYDREYRQRPGVREYKRIWMKGYYRRPGVYGRLRAYHNSYYRIYSLRPEQQLRSRINSRTRIARKRTISGTYTVAQIQEQLKRQRYRCYYAACGHAKFERVKGKYVYEIEHTFPISRVVGTDIPANDISYLVLSCPKCNGNKGNKYPWEWPEGGRLL